MPGKPFRIVVDCTTELISYLQQIYHFSAKRHHSYPPQIPSIFPIVLYGGLGLFLWIFSNFAKLFLWIFSNSISLRLKFKHIRVHRQSRWQCHPSCPHLSPVCHVSAVTKTHSWEYRFPSFKKRLSARRIKNDRIRVGVLTRTFTKLYSIGNQFITINTLSKTVVHSNTSCLKFLLQSKSIYLNETRD